MKENNKAITVAQFVSALVTQNGEAAEELEKEIDYITYGYNAGWLMEQDITGQELFLERKHAARIIHEFLKHEWKESDEIDGSPAYQLQDLFDCRVCAGHVIQVYVKGIMDGHKNLDGRFIFGMDELVCPDEMKEILVRVFRTECRNSRRVTENIPQKLEVISMEEALQYSQTEKNIVLIDVRTPREFEESHWKDAVNISLISILKNPYVVSENRDRIILLYCSEGYQSEAAARCLLSAGYETVYCFAWKERGGFTHV